MRRVRAIVCGGAVLVGLVLFPAVASAAPGDTPAGSGGGCRANGQAISGAARTVPVPFGQIVRGSAPIADDNAAFFAALCG